MPHRTEYSWLTTDELLQHIEHRDNNTPLERELAMRLSASIYVIHDLTANPIELPEQPMRFENG